MYNSYPSHTWLHNFFKNNGQIAAPLTTLLNKEAFCWTEEATKAFEKLKEAMCTTPILTTPDFRKTFWIGVVLMEEGRPISIERRQPKGKNLVKPIYEKEMLAIIHVVQKWFPYLIGRHFKVKTDHDSLKYFLEQWLSSEEKQKWVRKMLGYDFEIIYKKGKHNVVEDALFRK